jgi:3-hydroxybutyrate dehydrogenase
MSSHAISLARRRALITGGGKGIGRAIAQSLAEAGAQVIVSGRSAAALEEVAQATGGEAIVADFAAPAGVTAVVDACASFGRIDILVNNAGVAEGAPLGRTDDAMWERALTLNATAPFRLCRALLPAMIDAGWGRVINIASTAGLTGSAYTAAYCASKHALVGLTRALAAELGETGVTANALCPGWVDTAMADRAVARIAGTTGRSEAQARGALEGMSGQRRMMSAEEVAFAALTLCADHARGIHGQALVIDGGGLLR